MPAVLGFVRNAIGRPVLRRTFEERGGRQKKSPAPAGNGWSWVG